MRYRWGFIENGAFAECQPIVEDKTSLDYSQQSGEVFYRAKLNGTLSFRFEFDAIVNAEYNVEHIIVLQFFDVDTNDWAECWRGRFTMTDCEIDFDTNTISVQPETLDRYTKVLDGWEKEYNLPKMSVKQKPIGFLIRPCMQAYALNNSKVTNVVGYNNWQSDCSSLTFLERGDANLNVGIGDCVAFCITWASGDNAGKTILYKGSMWDSYLYGKIYSGNDWVETSIELRHITHDQQDNTSTFELYYNNIHQCDVTFEYYGAGLPIVGTWINTSGNVEDVTGEWTYIWTRTLIQNDESTVTVDGHTIQLYDLQSDDFAGINLNYNKIIGYACMGVIFSDETSEDYTEWGVAYDDRYFVKPADTPTRHYFPIGQNAWNYVSAWLYLTPQYDVTYSEMESALTVSHTIKDCYDYRSVVLNLFNKAGVYPQYFISRVTWIPGGANFVDSFLPIITPKSNVISSYYDTPAQNAPINLQMIFSMLKNAYRIYWHIDKNGNIHVEHISYYENGMHYEEDEPALLVDLESEIHTNTKNNKVFGQNKVKFDKQDMPEQYAFSWMDGQTRPFDGWPINCLDNYVSKGQKDDMTINNFSTDVDFCLSSPNELSKDGFFLFALPLVDGAFPNTLRIEKITIKDESGETYDVTVQNADAAFCKIHQSYWRYGMPSENIEVNNDETNALSTGNYKLQSVEFADSVMAEILKDVDNCNKIIRTQQGNGHIKTISINLNSLVAKGDLLFNFVGRWYYLKGTALGNSITIFVNGESKTISVSANKFTYRYKEAVSVLRFNAADVVSINFADCDKLDNLTSCDLMFDGCEELLAVDFGGKTFAAVTSANNMFRGCVALTTLTCPDSSTWKADLDFTDCPDLTTESLYDLIKFLYSYNAGVHTITPNIVMWNALDATVQNDLIAKATAKGWTINIPAAYSITGQSAASTVYATINGSLVEIPVTAGSWQYDYNSAITSFSFANDADVTDIDFSLSDGLSGVTSLNNAFKDCAGLTTVDFTNCDLSNVASASDAFANCSALYELIIPADSWQPDIDLSASVMPKTEMLNTINGLYVYTSGTHTISFNSTIWDAMSVADQQAVFNAADAKGWTTNAVAVVYVVRGTSSAASETFNIQFIQNGSLTPGVAETITVAVDGNGDWNFDFTGKKIYSLNSFAKNISTLLTIDFSDADRLTECTTITEAFYGCSNLTNIDFSNVLFGKLTRAAGTFANTKISTSPLNNSMDLTTLIYLSSTNGTNGCFEGCNLLTTINIDQHTFSNLQYASNVFKGCTSLTSLDLSAATFANVGVINNIFEGCTSLSSLDLSSATFASATNIREMFRQCTAIQTIDLSAATFASVTAASLLFYNCSNLQTIDLSAATFANMTTAAGLFMGCAKLTTISWSASLNLGKVVYFSDAGGNNGLFEGCAALQSVDFSTQTFNSLIYAGRMFWNCANLLSIDWTNAEFSNLALVSGIMYNATSLTTIIATKQGTMFSPSYTGNVSTQYCPLTYQSMLNFADLLRDYSGGNAHTCTYKASTWNALSTAEQNAIDSILSGKNWNRAIV